MFKCLPLIGCSTNRQVEKLDKRHCSLNEIPDDVLRHGKTLEECFLDANHLQTLPKAFFRLNRLRKLGLSDNEIELLPSDISNLSSLQELDLSKNDIQEIPEEIRYLKSLYFLDISSNPLQGLPEAISQLSSLTTLCLNDVSLTSLPHEFGNLSNLQALELRDNLVKSLPSSFSRLNNLLSLDLGNNEMEDFPYVICELPSLEVLLLDCNEIMKVPLQLGRIRSLTTIDFSDNHIEVLPDEIGNLSNLTDLLLSQNCLEQIPVTIGRLANLSILKVDHNRIAELPDSIGGCNDLTEMVLIENFLADLPETIGNLSELTILNVDKNSLTELPATVCQCRNLTILSLRKNRLQSLPMEIGLLDRLTVLDVSGNLIPHLPISISQLNSLKAIWLSENQSQAMPKFQTDVDPETGEEVLTCFLLPQQDVDPNFQPTLENLRNEKTERLASIQDVSLNIRNNTKVAFSGVETDSEEEPANPNYFTRHDTPHPKEFKTRHAQLFKNKKPHGDGTRPLDDLAKHQEKEHSKPTTPEPGYNEHRNLAEVTQVRNIENVTDQADKDDRRSPVLETRRGSELVIQRLTEEPMSRVGFSLPLQNNDDSSRPKLQPRSPTIEWPVKKTELPPPLPPRTVMPENSGSVQVQSVHVLEYDPPPIKKRRGSASSSVDDSMSSDEYADESDTDEHIEGQRKRVGFAETGDEGKDKCSLTRRNTPHYNRGRRVITEGELAEEAKRKVADIMTRRKELGPEGSPLSDQESYRPGSGTLTSVDQFSYTNASTVSPAESPVMNNGTTIIRQTNYIIQEPNEVDSDTGSGPVEKTVVKTFEKSPQRPEKPLKLLPVFDSSANRIGPEQIIKETVTQTTTTRGRPDSASALPMIPDRSSSPALAGSLPGSPVITIALRRSEHGLGLSIAGGKGSGAPYRENDEGIFVSKVTDGGPAQLAGLRVGDKVLTVNGFSVVDLGHHETVELLKNAGSTLIMMVQRDREAFTHPTSPRRELSVPAIPTHIERVMKKQVVIVTLPKGRAGLGFSIAGGKGTAPYKDNDESIFISKIAPGGTADRSGHLFIGDKILSINGTNIENAKHSEAVKLLTAPGQDISLEVERDIPLQATYVAPNVDPRTGKRFSYFVEPNRVNTVSTLRPSQSADFLSQVGNGQTTLPSSWRIRNGYPEPVSGGNVTERVIESEKIIQGVPSKPGSTHELNAPPPLKPRTKSVDGSTMTTVQPKSLISTGVLTENPTSPAKVNRKLQVNTIQPPQRDPAPRLVSRSSQSDLVELVMREEKAPPSFVNQASFSTRTVKQTVDNVSNGSNVSPEVKRRTYGSSSYTNNITEPPPKSSFTRNDLVSYPEPSPPKRAASPSILRSSLRKEPQQSFQAYKHEEVTVHTGGGPLGLSIVGGCDYWCAPFGTGSEDTGIFISKLVPGGAAARAGLLRIGDRILRVNGRDVTNVLHHDAVEALRANPLKTELLVQHDPPPEGLQELVVHKRPGETLGMNIRGGHKAEVPGNPLNLKDDGIFISRILPDGAAARDGRLKAGMRILEVNGESVLGCSHEDAVNALRQSIDRLYIMVCNGFDPEQAEALMATNVAIQHLTEVSPADADALRLKAKVQQKSSSEKTTEQLHEEMVKLHLEDALKRSAENEVQKLQNTQRMREEEKANEARRRQTEIRSWTKAPVLQHQTSVQDFIKREEELLAEQQRKREEEWRIREKQRWDEEMERRRRERLMEEDRVRKRREEEEKRIKAEIQEKLEADRRKREELLKQNRQRTPSAHSSGTIPPSPPPPLPVGYSSTTTMTTRTYSYNSVVEKKEGGGIPDAMQINGKGEKPLPPPINVAFSSSSNGDKPPITPRSSVPRQQARGPLAAMATDSSQTLKSPSAFTFKEKQMYFAKEIDNQPDDRPKGYLPVRTDPIPPSRLETQTSSALNGKGGMSPDYDSNRISLQPDSYADHLDALKRNDYLPPYRSRSPPAEQPSWQTKDYYPEWPFREEKRETQQNTNEENFDKFPVESTGSYKNNLERERIPQSSDANKPVRTAKAERRSLERQFREGSGDSFSPEMKLSPARERAEEAEKRAAWRADRLKSLDADTLRAQQIVRRMEELSRAENREPTPTSEHEFPRISLSEEISEPYTKERSRLVDEKVRRKLEEHIDPDTGKKFLTTTETVEQTVEHETETSKKKIIRLSVDDAKKQENGQSDF